MMSTWIEQYQSDDYGFNSSHLYCKIRLFELLRATEREPNPSVTRTAIVCDLFHKLAESPRYKEALSPFKNHLFSAIFLDYDEHSECTDYLNQRSYFSRFRELQAERVIISKRLSIMESRLKTKSELGDVQDGAAKLIDHILSMWKFDRKKGAFKAWKQCVVMKQQRIREICGKYRAFQISAKKIFLRWRTVASNAKKESIQMDIFRYRKHISVIENNLEFYKLKYNDLKQSSSEHIQRLLSDLSRWRIQALSKVEVDDEGMMIQNSHLLNKWKRYFCGYFMSLMELTKDRLDDVVNSHSYFDPRAIIDGMKKVPVTSYTKLKKVNELKDFSAENIVLNWINWRLLPTSLSISNFSKDFRSCKSYFVLLNLFRSDLFNLREVLEENSMDARGEKVVSILNRMNINDGPLIHAHDVLEGKADLNFVMIVRLMLLYSGIVIDDKVTFKTQYELLERTMSRCTKLRRSRKLRDIQHLHKFATECYSMVDAVENAIEAMRQRHTIWVNACSRIASGAQIYVTARMRDKPRSVNDEIQRAVKKEFGHISPIKLADILNTYPQPNRELEQLKVILAATTEEIQRVFCYYASNSEAGDMNMNQYLQFIQDIRVKGKGLPTSKIKKIFEIANLEEGDMNDIAVDFLNNLQNDDEVTDCTDAETALDHEKNDSDGDGDEGENDDVEQQTFELFDENPDDTLVGHEFVECLVRVAKRKFSSAKTLAKAYELLLEKHLRKYACFSNRFRDIILTPEIQHIFSEFEMNLKKIFCVYSKLSFRKLEYPMPSATDWLMLRMRINEFGSILKDCRLVGNSLTQRMLDITLSKIQKTEDGLLDYPHFCEALAAVACLRNPDPYVPLKAKITIFISLDLINPLIKGQLIKNSIKR